MEPVILPGSLQLPVCARLEQGSIGYDGCDGYLAAMMLNPGARRREAFSGVCGSVEACGALAVRTTQLGGGARAHFRRARATLRHDPGQYRPSFERAPYRLSRTRLWAEGFVLAMEDHARDWRRFESNPRFAGLLAPILAHVPHAALRSGISPEVQAVLAVTARITIPGAVRAIWQVGAPCAQPHFDLA